VRGRRRIDSLPEEIVVLQGRNVRPRLVNEDAENLGWSHPIEPWEKIHRLLTDSFSFYDSVPPELQKVLMMTTASVVYHMDWLINNLHPEHSFFFNTILQERV